MSLDRFATAISCIDGRIQFVIFNWIKKNHFVDYVDAVTEPGCDKVLSEKNIEKIIQIKSKVLISINAHGSKLIVVSGHHDCAANPSSKEMHLTQIRKSMNIVRSWRLSADIVGLWVNDQWKIEQIQE